MILVGMPEEIPDIFYRLWKNTQIENVVCVTDCTDFYVVQCTCVHGRTEEKMRVH